MIKKINNVLTEDFLIDMYFTCLNNKYILANISGCMTEEHLPDRDFMLLHRQLVTYYKKYHEVPSSSILKQSLSSSTSAMKLLQRIYGSGSILDTKQMLEQIEIYIKSVRYQKSYNKAGELFNSRGYGAAFKHLQEYVEWASKFSLQESEFVDVVNTFGSRYEANKNAYNEKDNREKPVGRFYIDELDAKNEGRDLRGQLTCFLASTGVGKSHAARWIGKNACQIDGLNVLHFQLEGSKEEVVNAYSASLVACNTYLYEIGKLQDDDLEKYKKQLNEVAGKLFVKSYPKFNANVSTIDIKNGIQDFKKTYGISPDVIIIDSMDLLIDASGRKYSENGERHKRIAVANDLKDLAADENVWVVTTYQSTIESRDWINDENNVLNEYNSAEAKGLARPLTHLITLNQSDNESRENMMRLFVAKSRFFKKGEPFVIATDYQHEIFYDKARTMNININKTGR